MHTFASTPSYDLIRWSAIKPTASRTNYGGRIHAFTGEQVKLKSLQMQLYLKFY